MATGMAHLHSAAWIIMIILFLVSYFVPKQKVKKVTHMILRLFYLIQIFSGGYMLFGVGGYGGEFHLKIVLAIILIGMMEMILVRQRKGKNTLPFWIIAGVLLVVIVLIGYGVITFG